MSKILIVDDDPDIVEALRLVLQREKHQVFCAYNREEGMAGVKAHQPDLLVLDVMMEQPDDGLAMAQELRRSGAKLPILMLTSISRVTGMSYGQDKDLVPVDAFLEKPVTPAALLAKVNQLLAAKKS